MKASTSNAKVEASTIARGNSAKADKCENHEGLAAYAIGDLSRGNVNKDRSDHLNRYQGPIAHRAQTADICHVEDRQDSGHAFAHANDDVGNQKSFKGAVKTAPNARNIYGLAAFISIINMSHQQDGDDCECESNHQSCMNAANETKFSDQCSTN